MKLTLFFILFCCWHTISASASQFDGQYVFHNGFTEVMGNGPINACPAHMTIADGWIRLEQAQPLQTLEQNDELLFNDGYTNYMLNWTPITDKDTGLDYLELQIHKNEFTTCYYLVH